MNRAPNDWWMYTNGYLMHHGIKGQHWGERNGPPYPLSKEAHKAVMAKVDSTARRVTKGSPNEQQAYKSRKAEMMYKIRKNSKSGILPTAKNRAKQEKYIEDYIQEIAELNAKHSEFNKKYNAEFSEESVNKARKSIKNPILRNSANEYQRKVQTSKLMSDVIGDRDFDSSNKYWAKLMSKTLKEASKNGTISQSDYANYARAMSKTINDLWDDAFVGVGIKGNNVTVESSEGWKITPDDYAKYVNSFDHYYMDGISGPTCIESRRLQQESTDWRRRHNNLNIDI